VFILLIFYSAPLSVLAEVLRTRSSASLYLPFAAMNVVNGLLWTTYGLALGDSFIYGPNLVCTEASVCSVQQHFAHVALTGKCVHCRLDFASSKKVAVYDGVQFPSLRILPACPAASPAAKSCWVVIREHGMLWQRLSTIVPLTR
jgi:hypothetical protein